jgi:hypothetical protein
MERPRYTSIVIGIIASIEMAIGLITVLCTTLYPLYFISRKPPAVFAYVLASSLVSAALGFGILKLNEHSRRLLVFFSGYVILTKVLIFAGLLEFKGEILAVPPPWIKDCVSLLYHILVIIALESAMVKKEFVRRGP